MMKAETSNAHPATLSVCLIVKNEEQRLARCLESVRTVADEIIVVDTGSTDHTVEIARQYTDRTFFHPWNDDFSEARNVSLRYATGDWILQIDADEVLVQEDIPLLRQAMQKKGVVAVQVALYNKLPDGMSIHYFPRLFRRGEAHYEGIVHNRLVYNGPGTTSEIRIHHEGYNLDPQAMIRKYQRTEALLQRHLQQVPGDLIATAQLVRVYREWGRFDKVLEQAPPALEQCIPITHRDAHQMLASDWAYALMQVGQLDEGIRICHDALDVHPQNLDLWFTLAGLYFRQKDYSRAAETLQRFLKIHDQIRKHLISHPMMMGAYGKGPQAWHNLGRCYEATGQMDQAIAGYQRACALDPARADFHLALAQVLTTQGHTSEAIPHLQKAIPILEKELLVYPNDAQRMRNLASCYLLQTQVSSQ